MKLKYAKLWLKKYIKYNHDNLDENKLNRAIINLSHRVYKAHGARGHNGRQYIRSTLVDYSKQELAHYNVEFQRPLKTQHRYSYPLTHYRFITTFFRSVVFFLKVVGFIILLLIIYYIIFYLLK